MELTTAISSSPLRSPLKKGVGAAVLLNAASPLALVEDGNPMSPYVMLANQNLRSGARAEERELDGSDAVSGSGSADGSGGGSVDGGSTDDVTADAAQPQQPQQQQQQERQPPDHPTLDL